MRSLVVETPSYHSPESLAGLLQNEAGLIVLRTGHFETADARYSFATADPFVTFQSRGTACLTTIRGREHRQYGNPWHQLGRLMTRYELLEETDLPFPLGGAFGFWGYDLKNFVEPTLRPRSVDDLELPDCSVGFYDSLVVWDHHLNKTWIVSTGVTPDGSRSPRLARERLEFWRRKLLMDPTEPALVPLSDPRSAERIPVASNMSRDEFLTRVRKLKDYIRLGHIYQANLSHRFQTVTGLSGWEFYLHLSGLSPAPYSGYYRPGDFELISTSPERFLRISGTQIRTRPIKGTRPRSGDVNRDAQLSYELQTSAKETAELIMITDLLRNDLGRVCEFGSVNVPELLKLEKYAHVQHLVSTVEGRLRPEVSHFDALCACFPGGSITGAPKVRAMEIIDELEPTTRGPYTGCLGYVGFNRETQLNILIRTAIRRADKLWFHAGAGIVADSDPEMEYEETLAKAAGFLNAIRGNPAHSGIRSTTRSHRSQSESPMP